jgi:chaperonin GroEL
MENDKAGRIPGKTMDSATPPPATIPSSRAARVAETAARALGTKAIKGISEFGDEAKGVAVIRAVLERPLRAIAENSGKDANEVIERVADMDDGKGFNAATGEYGDMINAGVIDPLKVVKTALTNAVSVASLLLTTEAVITDKPEPKTPAPAGGMGGGMGDY